MGELLPNPQIEASREPEVAEGYPDGSLLPSPKDDSKPVGDWPERNERSVEVLGFVLLFVLATLMVVADFAIVPLMNVFSQRDWGAIWVYLAMGCICAQVGVMAALLVWEPGPFWLRLIVHWTIAMACVAVWMGGVLITDWGDGVFDADLLAFLLVLPSIGLAVQLPLWITRQYFGWRLLWTAPSCEWQAAMSIGDLLVGTLIAAVSLGLLRVATNQNQDLWLVTGIAAPVLCAISAVSLLPIGLLMLRWHRWTIGLAFIVGETLLAAAVIVATVYLFGSGVRLWDMVGLMLVLTGFVATLVLTALAARAAGFRLATSR